MRSMTFSSWSLDADETTYAVMADHLLNGAVLYRDILDIKPPGVFVIFAIIQLIFGKSVLAIRLVSVLFITGSAFLLYRTKRDLGFHFYSSFLSAVIFVLMFNFYFGFPTNTEVFFTFFTALGVYLFFKAKKSKHYFLVGLIFGFGFLIKQLVLFDFAALGCFFLITTFLDKSFREHFTSLALTLIGFFVPFICCHLIFIGLGYYDYYYFVTYIAPGNYASLRDWLETLKFIFKGLLVYLPFFLLAAIASMSTILPKRLGLFIALMLVFDLLAIAAPGKAHPHYYLQIAYPISFAAGMIASIDWVKALFQRKYVRPIFSLLVIAYLIFLFRFYHKRYIVRPNYTENLARYVEKHIPKSASLYAGDAPQFLYWYLDKTSPTPYIHSTLMMRDEHLVTLEIDLQSELDLIYQTKPDYIILSEAYRHLWFKRKVESNYERIGQEGDFVLYRR